MKVWNALDHKTWSTKFLLIRRNQREECKLSDAIDFVTNDNLIINDFVFFKGAVKQNIINKSESRNIEKYFSEAKEKI